MLQTWLRMASTRNACHSSGRSNHSGPPASRNSDISAILPDRDRTTRSRG